MYDNCLAEISEAALRGNIQAIRGRVGDVPLCPAVKADAYGHDVAIVLGVLRAENVEQVAVANLDEALRVRSLGWHGDVLVLGAPLAVEADRERRERCRAAVAADFHVTIASVDEARSLAAEAARLHRPARVQVKIDSGMGRMGIRCESALETIAEICRTQGVRVEGVYTHFATADEPDPGFAGEQLAAFGELRQRIRAAGLPVRRFHTANSAACFRVPEACRGFDLVRPGICLYGYWDGPSAERPPDLTPAMRVVSRIAAARPMPAGQTVGYGRTFTTARPSVIGVVPIGYADGYRRTLGNNAVMMLPAARGQGNRTVPVVGRISMDQTTVDLTDAGDVRPGDSVVVIDSIPVAANSVEAIARALGTITYEITCLIGRRVRRVAAP